MKHFRLFLVSTLLSMTGITTGCQEGMENFDNNVYHESNIKVNTILLKGTINEVSRTISASIAKTEDKDIVITYQVEPTLVSTFNAAYYENAILLPEEFYEIPEKQVRIPAGSTHSTDITISFKSLLTLDTKQTYVLPVTMADANLNILKSARTAYYIFKGAALINSVATISENNLYVDWKKPEVVENMQEITVEALIWVKKFDRAVSTLMGIEDKFLIRIGDAGLANNQLQVVNGRNKATSPEWIIPTKEWVHIAITYNSESSIVEVYLNGKKKEIQTAGWDAVSWGAKHVSAEDENKSNRCFWIGHSYENERYLDGDISECRIWNRVLSETEINATAHFYKVEPASAGLVAYWKVDDGSGTNIKDYTANGNDATASAQLIWRTVELPKK